MYVFSIDKTARPDNPFPPTPAPNGILLPHPKGVQLLRPEPPPVAIVDGLIPAVRTPIVCRILPDRGGVRTTQPIIYQLSLSGARSPRQDFLSSGEITLLANGDLLTGNYPERRRLRHVYETPAGLVCQYEYRPHENGLTLHTYLPYSTAVGLWELVWGYDSDLYCLFEDMGDGVELDPLQRLAVFSSPESATVFLRRYADYRVEVRRE